MINILNIFANTAPVPIPAGCEHKILGMHTWFHFLKHDPQDSDACSVMFNLLPGSGGPSDVPLVLLAIVDDLLRIAGMVAVAFVIVGAVTFITSDGSPEKAAKGRETIINSLIGLAIAMTAIAFVSFLGARLT